MDSKGRGTPGWLACWAVALTATFGLLGAMWLAGDLYVGLGIIGASSLWAAWDSARVRVHLYRTQMANEPFMILSMCVMLWAIMFPWYVVIREGIRRGLVSLKAPQDTDGARER